MGAAFDKLIDKRDYVPEGLRVYPGGRTNL